MTSIKKTFVILGAMHVARKSMYLLHVTLQAAADHGTQILFC